MSSLTVNVSAANWVPTCRMLKLGAMVEASSSFELKRDASTDNWAADCASIGIGAALAVGKQSILLLKTHAVPQKQQQQQEHQQRQQQQHKTPTQSPETNAAAPQTTVQKKQTAATEKTATNKHETVPAAKQDLQKPTVSNPARRKRPRAVDNKKTTLRKKKRVVLHNPWNMFVKHNIEQCKANNPTKSYRWIQRHLSETWKNLTAVEKSKWAPGLPPATRATKPVFVYTLALEDNCFYVGETENVAARVQQHRDGKGSAWTRKHRPLARQAPNCNAERFASKQAARLHEDKVVKALMIEHGIDRVRGGSYSEIQLPRTAVDALLAVELKHAKGNCFNCNHSGHFRNECPLLQKTAIDLANAGQDNDEILLEKHPRKYRNQNRFYPVQHKRVYRAAGDVTLAYGWDRHHERFANKIRVYFENKNDQKGLEQLHNLAKRATKHKRALRKTAVVSQQGEPLYLDAAVISNLDRSVRKLKAGTRLKQLTLQLYGINLSSSGCSTPCLKILSACVALD